jgi:hypothetical protein
MSLTGGKRKVNKSLKAWVAFVKRVQKEEKLSYKEAIHRAKQRKDKGEKWMRGGQVSEEMDEDETIISDNDGSEIDKDVSMDSVGGRRRGRRTRRRGRRGSRRTRRRR